MEIYIVQHYEKPKIVGVFNTLNDAFRCVERNKPPFGNPDWGKEEYDIWKYELNKDDSGQLIYKAMR